MNFDHDELLLAIQATALRVAQDHEAKKAPSHVTDTASAVAVGRAAAQRAGLLELLGGVGASDEDGLDPQALCVALHTLAQHDTGLALYVWAQNVASSAVAGQHPELAQRWRGGEAVAVPLDLELGAGGGWYVSSDATLALSATEAGCSVHASVAATRSTLGVDGADVGTVVLGVLVAGAACPDLPLAVAGLASVAAAVGLRASRVAADYARVREQFGHPIAEFQAVRFMLADARTGAEAARLVAFAAAAQGDLASSARALATASAAARLAADVAVQVHGGAGYTRDYPAESLLRDASVLAHVSRTRFEASALEPTRSLQAGGHV